MWERWAIRGGSPLCQHSLSALKIQYNKCGMKPSKVRLFYNPNENMLKYVCIHHVVLNDIYWDCSIFLTIKENILNHTVQEKEICFADWLICKYKEKALKMKRIMLCTSLTLPIRRWEAVQRTVVLSDLHHLFDLNVVFVLLIWKMRGKTWHSQSRAGQSVTESNQNN